MSTTFTKLLDYVATELGMSGSATYWSRPLELLPWAIEAIAAFPILRPVDQTHLNAVMPSVNFMAMDPDFRSMITVEYPIGETPPSFLVRKNRFDQGFYSSDLYYDIDYDYSNAVPGAWMLFTSGNILVGTSIKVQYLAIHNIAMADDSTTKISVPDQYVHILVKYVVARAYRQKLSVLVANPTSYSNVITQLVGYIESTDKLYTDAINQALDQLTASRLTPRQHADKFDRVY